MKPPFNIDAAIDKCVGFWSKALISTLKPEQITYIKIVLKDKLLEAYQEQETDEICGRLLHVYISIALDEWLFQESLELSYRCLRPLEDLLVTNITIDQTRNKIKQIKGC